MPSLADEFPVTEAHIYLNHAAVAPWPKRTCDAIAAFARENRDHGAADYPRWLEAEKQLRGLGAALINAPSTDDIALLKNTSEGLSVVAMGLDWRPGDNIVGIHQEFPSNRVVWEALASRGVEFRPLDLKTTNDPEAGLMALCDRNTRLVAVSAVQFANGLKLELEKIGDYCRRNDILFCVDAIQQIGALPFDAQAIRADVVVADGHKWMLGPEGLALFYTRPDIRDRIALQQFGWHMRRNAGDYEPGTDWAPSHTATRFECGSPNMLGVHGLAASLSLLKEVGIDEVSRQIAGRVQWLSERVAADPEFELLSPADPKRQSGIVTFLPHHVTPEILHQRLSTEGVVCAQRGGGIRFSPHFYTPMSQVEEAWELVKAICRRV